MGIELTIEHKNTGMDAGYHRITRIGNFSLDPENPSGYVHIGDYKDKATRDSGKDFIPYDEPFGVTLTKEQRDSILTILYTAMMSHDEWKAGKKI